VNIDEMPRPQPGRHARRQRRGRLIFTIAAAFSMLAAATVVTAYAVSDDTSQNYSFFASADVANVPVDTDNRPVELGLKFTSAKPGKLSAVRFLKVTGDRAAHRVNVWNSAGQRLATAAPASESRSGWQQVTLTPSVQLQAGQDYVVSYTTSQYRATEDYFTTRNAKAGPLTTVGGGVYKYGGGAFPTDNYKGSNYWVDVVFKRDPKAATPAKPQTENPATVAPSPSATVPSPSASTSAVPSPSASSSATSTLPPAEAVKLDLPRVPWEGGPSYYGPWAQAKANSFTDQGFFPLGVWFESVQSDADVAKDKAAGLNTYIELTENSDMSIVRKNGMRAVTSHVTPANGSETIGWVVTDEADMWGGPGNGEWTGKWPGQGDVCKTRTPCGYDVMSDLVTGLPKDTRMRYSNFGKGVMFWQTDKQAADFVNKYTDVVSNDIYWYTDPHVCTAPAEGPGFGVPEETCRRAANYGLTMDRMRELDAKDGKLQPVYAFIEVGHPFSEDDAPTINGNQIAGAVMSSVIHEARGIIYFNHNFGGDCISQHVLREKCGDAVRPAVTETNRRLTSLAKVLNTQSYDWKANAQVDTMLKSYDGSLYLFAMPGRDAGTGTQKLTLPKGVNAANAEVLFENRTVPVSNGTITDTFQEEFSYHIYKITP
jgi:hypothetical protein